ncbi:M3 family oligoendopeptidase [Wukongibacter baidiensis]|uniref:M3 family oligoendopeptidase n=1 Tax=Wukongibacter baidiensis TaxID=1723361 RepID=UPI003D7F9AFD
MDLKWSLNELYPSFDSKEFKDDLEVCNKQIESIKEWTNNELDSDNNTVRNIEYYIDLIKSFTSLYAKLMAYTHLSFSVDSTNEEISKTFDLLQKKRTELTEPVVKFQKWMGNIGELESIISQSDLLKEHRFYLLELANKNKYLLSDKEEILLAKMTNTGSKAWEKLRGTLSSTQMVDIEIDGEQKQLPLSFVRNMAFDKDPIVRKNAFEAEIKSYEKTEVALAACLNGIKGEVLTVSKMRGFESPLEETLINSRMDKETLDAMLEAMKESLPAFRKYLRRKAEILGYKEGLPFYDVFAPVGKSNKSFTYEDARDYIVKNFRSFSDYLADYADNAINKRWIDVEPKKGKRGGAFCYNIHPIKESRILTNFTGSFKNVMTLAHELGHGYHGKCLRGESILNTGYPMPLAETASIFCETIVMNSALKEANNEDAFNILEGSLQNATQVIVDIYSRFLFESRLFEQRKEYSLSSKELNNLMLEAQRDAYGDGLDHDTLHPYMWANKTHYYYANRNFYNFPYAFGLLFAKGLYARYLEVGESFIEDYDKLLAVTGKNTIANVAKMMDIDVHSIDFWRSSLKLIEKDIKRFIELSESV